MLAELGRGPTRSYKPVQENAARAAEMIVRYL
jgi:hypothetical protein